MVDEKTDPPKIEVIEVESGERQLSLFSTAPKQSRWGKDNMNLSNWPTSVLAQAAPGQLTLRFHETIVDPETGEDLEQEVLVSGVEEWGIPTYKEDEILLGLLQICRQQGFPKSFRFTRYQLIKTLGWTVNGHRYEDLYTGLHRLTTTNYTYRWAWRNMTERKWMPSVTHTLLQSLTIYRLKDQKQASKTGEDGFCAVTLSDWFHESLTEGNLRTIDYQFWKGIKNPTARRMYRYLDFRMHRSDFISLDLETFALSRIGINKKYKGRIGKIKESLRLAISELEEKQFIQPLPNEKRYTKVRKGKWQIHFQRYTPQLRLPMQSERMPEIVERMIAYGVSARAAKTLAEQKGESFVDRQIQILEFNISRGKTPDNPGAWLATACRDGFDPPPGFLSREELLAHKSEVDQRAEKVSRDMAEAKKLAEKEQRAANTIISEFLENECSDELKAEFSERVGKVKAKFRLGDHFDEAVHLKLIAADYLLDVGRLTPEQRQLI